MTGGMKGERREKRPFRFKQFSCHHYRSAMRIGVDGVLTGAWCDVTGNRILDVGTGCGLIALMCAQRNPDALVDAVEVDLDSVEEARGNFQDSPWSDRLSVKLCSFTDYKPLCLYDLIVSNPPYFTSGVDADESSRMRARHEGELSPVLILRSGRDMLTPAGRIAMIVPYLRADEMIKTASDVSLALKRRTDVKGNPTAPYKRTLLEFTNTEMAHEPICDELILEESIGIPTTNHRVLCHDFYLKF